LSEGYCVKRWSNNYQPSIKYHTAEWNINSHESTLWENRATVAMTITRGKCILSNKNRIVQGFTAHGQPYLSSLKKDIIPVLTDWTHVSLVLGFGLDRKEANETYSDVTDHRSSETTPITT
jgi:hypothetical protein